jgi:mRNA interferase HigB
MKIFNKKIIDDFARKHADSLRALQRWIEIMENAECKNLNELKQIFPHADNVGNSRIVFNIKGNRYRLIAVIVFIDGFAMVRYCGTHADYDKIRNIENI